MNFKEYCLLNQKNFDQVKSIEKEVYPSRMQTYQDFDNIEDLLDYADCNGQIDCIVKNDWYAIFCNGAKEVEIIDLASRKPLSLIELIEVKNKLLSFGDKIITMNARESTSYKLIMAAAKRGMFEILSDEPNNEFGEPMHELVLKIKQQNSFKEWFSIQEAIDASTKELLLKAKAPKDELDAFVKELEDEPNLIDKKTAFQRSQSKFNIQKKTKDEDGQRQHFASVPNTTEEELKTYDYYKDENPQALREMMELLRKFIDKKLITLKFENDKPVLIRNTLQGEQKFDTPDFTRFMSSLHGVQASLQQYTGKGNYFNPIEEELNHQNNLVAKGDNVWVFKGHAPDVCRIYGKGHPWCISSSTSAAHWFSYRVNHHQTQYFVFDFNKDENDPARYVNPGVAPKGMYSEWVDARNQHSVDPEDVNSNPRSHVGINGYSSINKYKKYLESKKIPLDIWTTTPPEKWEKRLKTYDRNKDFQGAKNDDDPRVFPMYLKIVDEMHDSDFETLDKEQKIDFVMGKITELTNKQLEFVKTNIKKSDYYSSLQDLNDKIEAAAHFNDKPVLQKIASMPELSDENVFNLLKYAKDKDEMARLIQKDRDNISKLSDHWIEILLIETIDIDIDQIAQIIIQYRKKLSDSNVHDLICHAKGKYKIAELIINKKPYLSTSNVEDFLKYAIYKDQMVRLLQKDNDNISKLDDFSVIKLMSSATDKDQMALTIIQYKKELSDDNIKKMLKYAIEKDEIAEQIINKIPKLSVDNVYQLLSYANDKNHIAELLGSDNISELSDINVRRLIKKAEDPTQMAQIIDKYHQKKTPEIQKLIDKYLS